MLICCFRVADIHVAIDGNFHHRHQRYSGDCPDFYNASYFLSKEDVDKVGKRIEIARKAGRQRRIFTRVPEDAIDACESSFEAADEKQAKTNGKRFDDMGLMALVCRHDIPIFFANIDSPGEQQKYSVALIEALFNGLPAAATVLVLYDIGCVLDRSLTLVSMILSTLEVELIIIQVRYSTGRNR